LNRDVTIVNYLARTTARREGKAMRQALYLFTLAFAFVACRKTSSPAFYEAQSKYEVLSAKEGDDVYLSGALTSVVDTLNQVNSSTLEYERATALIQKIERETARVKAERAAAQAEPEAPKAAVPAVPRVTATEPVAQADAVEAVDAGMKETPEPERDMTPQAFAARYQGCVRSVSTAEERAAKKERFEVTSSPECQKRLKADPDGVTQFEFAEGKLKTRTVLQTKTVERNVDAGTRQITTIQSGFLLPGMPTPEPSSP
jgi:hypothetical protein